MIELFANCEPPAFLATKVYSSRLSRARQIVTYAGVAPLPCEGSFKRLRRRISQFDQWSPEGRAKACRTRLEHEGGVYRRDGVRQRQGWPAAVFAPILGTTTPTPLSAARRPIWPVSPRDPSPMVPPGPGSSRHSRIKCPLTQDVPPPLQVQPEPTDGCSPPHASRIVRQTPSRFSSTAEFQNRITRSPRLSR